MLLSYERYKDLGGDMPENQFLLYENIAEAELYAIGNGALPITPTVEACMMIMLDAYEASDRMRSTGTAQSYSNDGVSVTYAYTETPNNLLDLARERVKLLFQRDGVTRYLGVRHRE